MGWTHAASGTLAFGGATLLFHFGLEEIAIGTVITTGAAMINDLDHKNAHSTKTFGFVSWVAHHIVVAIFGPHRHGTHGLIFPIALGIGAQVAITYRHSTGGMIAISILMILAVASAVRLLKIHGIVDDAVGVLSVIGIVWFTDVDLRIVPACLMLGALTHIVGDCLTDRGCPLFWPISMRKFTLGIFTTGKTGEKIVRVIIVLGIIAIIPAHIYLERITP